MAQDRKPALDAALVQEFVGKAHGDLARVTELLTQEPALVNASWDWGGGDFETALGAAAHTGRKEIANLLLANGARLDVFAAAMLGKLAIVKSALAAYPDAIGTPGPHGIPLLTHAEMGGEAAAGPRVPALAALSRLHAAPGPLLFGHPDWLWCRVPAHSAEAPRKTRGSSGCKRSCSTRCCTSSWRRPGAMSRAGRGTT